MNYIQMEILAELERRRIVEEMDQIHLAEKVDLRVPRTKLLRTGMYRLGGWMMALGQRLRDPYEASSVRGFKPTRHSLAR